MVDDVLLVETRGGITTLTLHRPEKRNALTPGVLRALRDALGDVERDPSVACVVLTGTDPAFCAGLDLDHVAAEGLGELGAAGNVVDPPGRHGPLAATSKPVIGAINGVAVTGGLELALACTFLVASDRAAFADTHARVGVQPAWGLTIRLPEAVGAARAREMSATSRFIDAQTALAWGLVNHVVAHDDLLAFTHTLAAEVVANDEHGVARLLKTYDEQRGRTSDAAWTHEAETARAWTRERFRRDEVGQRAGGIIERGRHQVGGDA